MNHSAMTVRPDTSDMVRIHRVFRQALCLAPQLLGGVEPTDVEQVGRITTFYEGVLLMVRFHHEGEDELLWPRLRARCPTQLASVERAADQHNHLHDELEAAEELLRDWRTTPTVNRAATLAGALATLAANLTRHLDDEERDILPLIEQHLSAAEWHELPAHGVEQWRTRAPQLRWLAVGLIREQQSPELQAELNAALPSAVREWWQNEGEPTFQHFIAALRR